MFSVSNPATPYEAPIPGGLNTGYILRIKGLMTHMGDRFVINFTSHSSQIPGGNIGLHISVRPNDNQIVLNNFVRGGWGNEEIGRCIIRPGQPFDMLINVEYSSFKITINGQHLANFNHRLSLSSIQNLHIYGAIRIEYIGREYLGGTGPAPPYTPPPCYADIKPCPVPPPQPPPVYHHHHHHQPPHRPHHHHHHHRPPPPPTPPQHHHHHHSHGHHEHHGPAPPPPPPLMTLQLGGLLGNLIKPKK